MGTVKRIVKWAAARATRDAVEIAVSLLGGWWSLMSGAVSIPLAVFALALGGKPTVWLTILGFVALWGMVVKMALDKYKAKSRERVAIVLGNYFKLLDTLIDLLKREKMVNEVKEAGDTLLEGIELCGKIQEFIAGNIGTTEAILFAAKGDKEETHSGTHKPDFFALAISSLTDKLLKLKGIMERYR